MRKLGNTLGAIIAISGAAIILAVILPSGVLWLIIGIILFLVGKAIYNC